MALSVCLWNEGLADDIYHVLRNKEQNLPFYFAQSPELHLRRKLVDWLASMWDACNLCHMTRHLAVSLLDYFMDRYSIEDRQIYLVAIGCLLVASKFEELDINIPRACELNQFMEAPGFSNAEYCNVELTILDFFKWNISLPTAAHFTDYFIKIGMSCSDQSQACISNKFILQYVNYFLEISLQDHFYRNFLPSQVAAACVASTRVVSQLMPTWPSELQQASGYPLKDLCPLMECLLKTHKEDEAHQVAKAGMLTPPATPQSKMTHQDDTQSVIASLTKPVSACLPVLPQSSFIQSSPYSYNSGGGDAVDMSSPYSPSSIPHDVIYISEGTPVNEKIVTVMPANCTACYTGCDTFMPHPGRIQ